VDQAQETAACRQAQPAEQQTEAAAAAVHVTTLPAAQVDQA
jgi:hypothetical protein